jgi:ATP-dependent phosphofructokinase / diphosphate-dependent phosphofructokinase
MGSHAGFLTAGSALARRRDWDAPLESTDGPQLIYVPETPFEMDRFAADVEAIYSKKGRCHIAVSEGIVNAQGEEIGSKLIRGGQVDAHGNVQLSGSGALGDALADFIKEKLTPKGGKAPRVRADTFGYAQRCWPDPSPVDAREARRSGRFAAQQALAGKRSGSITIQRKSSDGRGLPYLSDCGLVELSAVAGKTRVMPREFLSGHNNVSRAFIDYCLPLVGELPVFERI